MGTSFEDLTLGDFIEEVLRYYEDSEKIKRLFILRGYPFRDVPQILTPTEPTRVTAVEGLAFHTVLNDAQDKFRWYQMVKAAGYNTLRLNEEQINHVLDADGNKFK